MLSLDFDLSLESLAEAEAAIANPYLTHPEKGLELVARLIGQPLPDSIQEEQNALLAQLHELIHTDFMTLAEKGSYPGEAQALRELLTLEESLENLALFPDLTQKNIIGVGGGFSAGKSRFLNTFLGVNALPESLEPTTAIPSFITYGEHDDIVALNSFNHKASLDQDALQAITHAFNQRYRESVGESFGFSHILKLLMLHSSTLTWHKLAFLDTPGYSKADTQGSAQTDAAIAQRQLSEADHVLWLLNAKNGSIRSDDLDFLRTLNHGKPIFFVITQSDLVGENRIKAIMQSTREALKSSGIPCAGLMAWAAPMSGEHSAGYKMAGDDINKWLTTIEKEAKPNNYVKSYEAIFDGYIDYNNQGAERSRTQLSFLNHLLVNKAPDFSEEEQALLREMLKKQRSDQLTCKNQAEGFNKLKAAVSTQANLIIEKAYDSISSVSSLLSEAKTLYEKNEYNPAFEKFKKAADKNSSEAEYYIGVSYAKGHGVVKSNKSAADWYEKAANKQHNDAQYELGLCFLNGKGVNKDGEKAIYWLKQAAEQKHILANYQLGACYYHGEGVAKAQNTAQHFLQIAAQGNYPFANYLLGESYFHGRGATKDRNRAKTIFGKAIKGLQSAAYKNNPESQYYLANCHYYGFGIKENEQQAFKHYEMAAAQGLASAQYRVADCYFLGRGTAINKTLAKKFYSLAAAQGHEAAANDLKKYFSAKK